MPTVKAVERARALVERSGILVVYPIDGRPDVPSLWSALYPRVKMEWSWDEDADPRVAEVWHLRERLQRTHDVAYAKWFRQRATFFSLPVFTALLGRITRRLGDVQRGLPAAAVEILELLRERSPLSTKEVRAGVDLRGKANEAMFTHAMKALWTRLLIVGTGEVPDGAFPSLSFGATELLFEDAWNERRGVPADAEGALDAAFARTPAFAQFFARSLSKEVQERGERS
ncbi:MAG: hypothetical protein KIT84_20420 [Labilithrix sp.]|nr:hypothetical protein [Labilithrix sp.]MCW5813405.1 hypothetical protein [Labilithrix sp.]